MKHAPDFSRESLATDENVALFHEYRAITDRQLVRALQQAVIDAIAAEPREVAQRILDRLKARRRPAVGLPALEGGSDVA